MTFQIADVKGPFVSVLKICRAGNRVVFDDEGSYLEHKLTRVRTPIRDIGGKYIMKSAPAQHKASDWNIFERMENVGGN